MEGTHLLSNDSSRYSGDHAAVDDSGAKSELDLSRSGRGKTLLVLAVISSLAALLLGFYCISLYLRAGSISIVVDPRDDAMLCTTICSDPCSTYEVRITLTYRYI